MHERSTPGAGILALTSVTVGSRASCTHTSTQWSPQAVGEQRYPHCRGEDHLEVPLRHSNMSTWSYLCLLLLETKRHGWVRDQLRKMWSLIPLFETRASFIVTSRIKHSYNTRVQHGYSGQCNVALSIISAGWAFTRKNVTGRCSTQYTLELH